MNYNRENTRYLWHNSFLVNGERTGVYDTPVLEAVQFDAKTTWIPFNMAMRTKARMLCGIHFFEQDQKFERVWNDPTRYMPLLKEFRAVLSPDFSMFTDWPKSISIYNHYRKHQLAQYWAQNGITVIPTIGWVDESSFDWCFDGEPVGSTVAVSSMGTQKQPDAKRGFLLGYNEMMKRLRPTRVLFFGKVPVECAGDNVEVMPSQFDAEGRYIREGLTS